MMTSKQTTRPAPVYSFNHFDKTYHVMRTADFPWRLHLGFKPKQPYVLTDGLDYTINAVSEADLAWYRENR